MLVEVASPLAVVSFIATHSPAVTEVVELEVPVVFAVAERVTVAFVPV